MNMLLALNEIVKCVGVSGRRTEGLGHVLTLLA